MSGLSTGRASDRRSSGGVGRRFGDLPEEAAARWGDRESLVFEGQRYTFRQVAHEVERVARGLVAAGVAPGDRVAIWLVNRPEWVFSMFACARIGAVHVPINTRFRTADAAHVLARSQATTLITHDVSGPIDYLAMVRELAALEGEGAARRVRSAALPRLQRVILASARRVPGAWSWPELLEAGVSAPEQAVEARAAAVRPTDTAFIMFTSGTTGFPKGVMRDHLLVEHLEDRHRRLQSGPADVLINYLPLFHIFGYVEGPLGSLIAGYRHVLTSGFDADEALDLIERERGTLIDGFEAHFAMLIDAQRARPRDVSSLRTGVMAGGALSAAPIAYAARKVLAPFRHLTAYGMTEVGAAVTLSRLDSTEEQACESSGLPSEGCEVRVADPDSGRDQPPGVPGEILIRSRYAMQGYDGDPEATARAFDADGWFHTGDAGVMRPDGYMRFVGRYKDMLKVGGENVDPLEVERYLLGHPAIRQVAVVGYPDARLGEVPVAFVETTPGGHVTAEDVSAFCRGRIATFKVPRHVLAIEALPMTPSGKVQKAVLREEARRRLG